MEDNKKKKFYDNRAVEYQDALDDRRLNRDWWDSREYDWNESSRRRKFQLPDQYRGIEKYGYGYHRPHWELETMNKD